MRKVTVDVKVRLILNIDDGIEVGDVINEIDYVFYSDDNFGVEDQSIEDFDIVDSK